MQQSIFKRSYNRTLIHNGMSHDIAEQCDAEWLEQATDNSSNSQETFVEAPEASLILTACRDIKAYPFCTLMHCLQILQLKCKQYM